MEVSWRMKYFLFMGIGIYVNELFFKSMGLNTITLMQLVYLLLLFLVCQKVVYFLIFCKILKSVGKKKLLFFLILWYIFLFVCKVCNKFYFLLLIILKTAIII